jgi:hypothetical protein
MAYLVSDIQVYLINKTALTGMRYYSYYDDMVDLYLQNRTISITVKEFLEYYFYGVKYIHSIISANKSQDVSISLQFLVQNW